jgi:alanine-synthesizing transaminase
MRTSRPPFGSARSRFRDPSDLYLHLGVLARAHEKFIDLTISNPEYAGLAPQLDAYLSTISVGGYRPDPRGTLESRACVARAREPNFGLTSDDVLITASTSEAYYFLLLALCDPGDSILVPTPSYPLFEQLAQLASVQLHNYRIEYDGAWHIDLSSLPTEESIVQARIRFVVAVSPNNPTGNVLRKDELQALRRLKLPVVIDEVFAPYRQRLDPSWEDPLLSADCEGLTIVLDGLSKRTLAPGLKVGWMIARGTQAQGLFERLEWIGDSFLSVNAQSQAALSAILQDEELLRKPAMKRIADNLETLRKRLEMSPITPLDCDGGWSAILRFPATQSEEDWWRALSQVGLWLSPGSLYGLPLSPTFVVSLLTPEDQFGVALTRLCLLLTES